MSEGPGSPPNFLIRTLISERFVVSVILANAVAMTVSACVEEGSRAAQLGLAADMACVAFFVLEAALKVNHLGWRSYWSSGWNRFDLSIVALSLPLLASPWIDLREFGVVLTLRLGRLFRLLRLLRFIPNRERLASGIERSLKASVAIILALALLCVILALGATFLFGRLVPEHFGNPALSVYSLFRVFTVEGWYELPELIAARADHVIWSILARAYFAGSVLAGGILGLSLANAVFVDEMMMDNNEGLEAKVDSLHAEILELKALLGARSPGATPAVVTAIAPEPEPEPEAEPERSIPVGSLAIE